MNAFIRSDFGGTGGAFTASPVASDGKIYLSSEDGDVFVVKAGPKYELLAKNPVGEVMMATPAISDGLVIVRTVSHLYAFGETPVRMASQEMSHGLHGLSSSGYKQNRAR